MTTLSPDLLAKSKASLLKHEGKSNTIYNDGRGNWTIGCGYNISARGLPDDWIFNQLQSDIEYFHDQLDFTFPWYKDLSLDRQCVLIDMAFMGWRSFMQFDKMFDCCENYDWDGAERELLNSEYAKQVGQRAIDLGAGLRTGVYNV